MRVWSDPDLPQWESAWRAWARGPAHAAPRVESPSSAKNWPGFFLGLSLTEPRCPSCLHGGLENKAKCQLVPWWVDVVRGRWGSVRSNPFSSPEFPENAGWPDWFLRMGTIFKGSQSRPGERVPSLAVPLNAYSPGARQGSHGLSLCALHSNGSR